MAITAPSALITDNGRLVLLQIHGRHYELTQDELRAALALPKGPPGLGISIDGEQVSFEFAKDNQSTKMSAAQLHRRLVKHDASKTGSPR